MAQLIVVAPCVERKGPIDSHGPMYRGARPWIVIFVVLYMVLGDSRCPFSMRKKIEQIFFSSINFYLAYHLLTTPNNINILSIINFENMVKIYNQSSRCSERNDMMSMA